MLALEIPITGLFDGTTAPDPTTLRFTQQDNNVYLVEQTDGTPLVNLGLLNPYIFLANLKPNPTDDWLVGYAMAAHVGATSIVVDAVMTRAPVIPLWPAVDLLGPPPTPPTYRPPAPPELGGMYAMRTKLLTGSFLRIASDQSLPNPGFLKLALIPIFECPCDCERAWISPIA